MHKVASIVIVGVTLAAHATGAMLVQGIKVEVNYFLCRLLLTRRHRKGHYIPYHKAYSFGLVQPVFIWQQLNKKCCLKEQHLG